eukprot:m.227359 g.227359  ORF g.227359 m.227359 type:complete len:121 (-) comp17322_c0_seq7:2880-3242(-)
MNCLTCANMCTLHRCAVARLINLRPSETVDSRYLQHPSLQKTVYAVIVTWQSVVKLEKGLLRLACVGMIHTLCLLLDCQGLAKCCLSITWTAFRRVALSKMVENLSQIRMFRMQFGFSDV